MVHAGALWPGTLKCTLARLGSVGAFLGVEVSQDKQIEKAIKKYGGSPEDVWAVGQMGSGFVRFDGQFVHIQHSGILSRASVGKGSKRIPVRSITAIHLKPAGPVVSGYIQFSIGGANEARARFGRQSFDAASDENSIMFTKKEQPYFEALRDALESAIATPQSTGSASDPVQQLKGLSDLRDAGILTEEEFAKKKDEILRRM